MEPTFMDYQLVGSSMLLRFAATVLGEKPKKTSSGSLRVGLCVSGQTTCQLMRRLKTYPHLGEQILLMIGVNDFKKGTRLRIIKMRLMLIVKFLETKARKIVLLTLPPIPLLRGEREGDINIYNKFILNLGKRPTVSVLDINHLFKHENGTDNLDLFERFIGNPSRRRVDLVHWNRKGIRKVEEALRDFLYK